MENSVILEKRFFPWEGERRDKYFPKAVRRNECPSHKTLNKMGGDGVFLWVFWFWFGLVLVGFFKFFFLLWSYFQQDQRREAR